MVEQRNGWNDDRLDELSGRVDAGFAKVDRDMKDGFAEVDARFDKIDEKFERLYHVLIAGIVVIVGALVGVPALGG